MAQTVSRRPPIATSEYHPRPIHARSVVNKVAIGQVFVRELGVYLARAIPPLPTRIFILKLFLSEQTGDDCEPSNKAVLFRRWGTHFLVLQD
jgi:hypothetical protein